MNKDENEKLDSGDAAGADELSIDDMDSGEFGDYIASVKYGGDGSYTVDAEDALPENSDDELPEDGGGTEGAAEPENDNEPHVSAEPFKSYLSEEDWKNDIAAEVNKYRLHRDDEEKQKYGYHDKLLALLPFFYGDTEDKLGALIADLTNQKSAKEAEDEKAAAEAAGKSIDDYRADKSRDEDAAKWREQEERRKNEENLRDSLVAEWLKDAGKLKLLHDDFDLKDALANALFKEALGGGKNVFEAYMAMKKEAPDTPEAPEEKEPPKPKRDPIMQNASSSAVGRGNSKTDPSRLSSKDFKKYIDSVKNGYDY
ncbi:MAG: hypothetical protein ACI38A_05480 [Candidatus Ornithomonoglobus sp.]